MPLNLVAVSRLRLYAITAFVQRQLQILLTEFADAIDEHIYLGTR